MSKKLKLKIVTPERLILEEDVDQVTFPTTEGELTILPDHIPLIAGLSSGDVVALTNGEHTPFAVAGGFVEVKSNKVILLAESAERSDEIDVVMKIDAFKNGSYQEVLNDFEGKYTKQMNFDGFGKGVYMITLTSTGSKIAKKVVIY